MTKEEQHVKLNEVKELYLKTVSNYFDFQHAYIEVENKDIQKYCNLSNHFYHDFTTLTDLIIDVVNNSWSEEKEYGDKNFDKETPEEE